MVWDRIKNKTMKRFLFAIALGMGLMTTACQTQTTDSSPSKPLKLGSLFALTGDITDGEELIPF